MATKQPQRMVQLQIGVDPLNKEHEQFKVYQLDGETVRVKIGEVVEVPLWVGEAAVRAGDVLSFKLI